MVTDEENEILEKIIMESSDDKWNALGQALADGIKYRIFCRRLTPLAEEFKELLRENIRDEPEGFLKTK